jgi:hypothetical protein
LHGVGQSTSRHETLLRTDPRAETKRSTGAPTVILREALVEDENAVDKEQLPMHHWQVKEEIGNGYEEPEAFSHSLLMVTNSIRANYSPEFVTKFCHNDGECLTGAEQSQIHQHNIQHRLDPPDSLLSHRPHLSHAWCLLSAGGPDPLFYWSDDKVIIIDLS